MEDKSKEASSVINRKLYAVDTSQDREKALTDLVIRVKKAALDRKKNMDDGLDPLTKAKEEKKILTELRQIRIKI